MADKKLSELTETTTGSDTMQLFVNDAGVSKRITRGNLISGAVSAATTTYSIKAGTQIGGAGLELDAGGAGTGTDTIKLMESGSATVTRTDADTITIGATNTTYVDATTSVAGLMSTSDKTKIDGVATSANEYTHPNHSGDIVSAADGATIIQTGAVDIAMLSATGTASGTTFLRGDNTWVVPTDTNTDTKWDGGTTGLTAATGRTSLGLGTAATSAATAFETADTDISKTDVAETRTASINMADNVLQKPELKDYAETVNAIGSIGGGTQDINLELGNVVTATVDTSTTTFTFSGMPATGKGGAFTLILTNGASQTVNFPLTVDWAAGTAPTLTTAGIDVLTFTTVDGGTIWYGIASGLAMA